VHLLVHVCGKDSVVTDQPGKPVEENVRAQSEAQKRVGDFALGHVMAPLYFHATARIPSSASTFIVLPLLQLLRKSPRGQARRLSAARLG